MNAVLYWGTALRAAPSAAPEAAAGRRAAVLLGATEFIQYMGVIFTNSRVSVHNKFCSLCVRSMFLRSSSIERGAEKKKEVKHRSY
jgi:hypothetical protein